MSTFFFFFITQTSLIKEPIQQKHKRNNKTHPVLLLWHTNTIHTDLLFFCAFFLTSFFLHWLGIQYIPSASSSSNYRHHGEIHKIWFMLDKIYANMICECFTVPKERKHDDVWGCHYSLCVYAWNYLISL